MLRVHVLTSFRKGLNAQILDTSWDLAEMVHRLVATDGKHFS